MLWLLKWKQNYWLLIFLSCTASHSSHIHQSSDVFSRITFRSKWSLRAQSYLSSRLDCPDPALFLYVSLWVSFQEVTLRHLILLSTDRGGITRRVPHAGSNNGVIFAAARWRALKLFVRLTSLSQNRCQETERRETVKRPFHLRVVSSGAWMFSAPAFLTHCPTKGLVARDAASGLSQTIWVTVRGGER